MVMDKVNDLEETVLVRVKSASHPSCEDVEFSCDPKLTTVRQVKEKIRTLYSFHPDIADQRLIYAGHLLDDVQLLTDVFGLSGGSFTSGYQHSGPYTIHLACTSKSYISSSQRVPRSDNSTEASSQGSVFSSQIPNPMMQDPRHATHANPFEINGNTGIPPEFYALHQLYVEQMSAYMRSWSIAQTMSSGVPGFGTPGVAHFPNANIPNVVANNAPPAPAAPAGGAAAAAPPQNERARPAAGANFGGIGGIIGGPAAGNDDEENQRDLLDWAYTLSRVFLILGVVYFYSNFTRFLLVVIFTLAIALFQRRPLFNQANERQRNNNNNNNHAHPPGAPAANDNRDGGRANGNNAENPQNAAAQENDENVQAEGGNSPADAPGQAAEGNIVAGAAGAGQHRFAYYRDVTWTFLTTFFTSLIPEMPQHN